MGKRNAPEMMGLFPETTSCSEATQTTDGMSNGQARGKSIARSERGNLVFANVPGGNCETRNKSTGKNSTCLQGAQAENIAQMAWIRTPLIDDVQQLGADYPGENHIDAQVLGMLRIDALFSGIADTDPKPEQNACCY